LDGSEPDEAVKTVARGLQEPDSLAAAGGYLYYTIPETGTVHRVSKRGGTPETLARHQAQPTGVLVDSAAVYWINGGHQGGEGSLVKLERL
ncbi:MAG: hypothetical protein JRI23_20920, partial [Deltaproteobacteria bacterium]|nr:hypothetical protein [Deltaproteobacteria bacterium]MBW2534385.1 hypothetical protein [Deltaproteobacteria bacterium]